MTLKNLTVAGYLLIAVAASGCDSSATKQKLAQLTAVSAEKDSLLALVSENARLMSDISTTLEKVRDVRKPINAVVSPESPLSASVGFRDSLKAKVAEVVERLNQAETRLAATSRRMRGMTGVSDSLKAQLATMEQSVTDLQATMENQRISIASMTEELEGMKQQNAALTERNTALVDTVSSLDKERNTVYYVIGTKEDLKARGVLVEEGSKFLFFGAKVVAPARDLNPEVFTAIDKHQVADIPLPSPDADYKIVSRQNLAAVGTPMKNGQVRGDSLKITEPDRFWAPSRYLIIVQG